ncbi:MAG: type II toxin-antitoxin system RelE/ParE family toxin [Clostridiales Family XIII bacterium]|jgi:plasmid stabilization system protein ParE|nr:type II toxin-antitoxin system RelE/ParE family toxin [Clostridiales Family XIII bacterium]
MTKILYSPESRADSLEIRLYITNELKNPTAAANLLATIKRKIFLLKASPLMGTLIDDELNVESKYRFLICNSYYIFYRIESDSVKIVRIISQRRDYMRILFGDNVLHENIASSYQII